MLVLEKGVARRHGVVDDAGSDLGIAGARVDDVVDVADDVQAVAACIDLRDIGADQRQGGIDRTVEVDDFEVGDLRRRWPSGRTTATASSA